MKEMRVELVIQRSEFVGGLERWLFVCLYPAGLGVWRGSA